MTRNGGGGGTVATTSPTVLKWWIALELTQLRERAGLSRQQVAEHVGCVVSAVRHVETGRNLPRPLELREMLTLYGVPERVERFAELVSSAKKGRDWFEVFAGAAPPWFDLFLGLESSAAQIESYDAMVVPGLFQTAAYAEAVIQAGDPELSDAEVSRRIELRLARQDVLTREPDPPTVWSVLDESTLYRTAGSPAAMREQLTHLLNLAQLPTLTIQVLPMAAGPHIGIDGTFIMFEFPDLTGSPTVAYTDAMIQVGRYYEQPEHLRRYRNALTHLRVAAAKPAESVTMIAQRAQELS
ncbi:MAG: helix-turn-helix domain-containing protein [Pseudonocardiaceae bacterium]